MSWVVVEFLALPALASIVIAGLHVYLGLHVVERGVIFVDLALAQIAVLGGTIALLVPAWGGDPHGPAVYWMSLAFTLAGAAIFSFVKGHRARIPQEAIIGIAYVVASGAVIIAMSQTTAPSERLRNMLVGNIVAVSVEEVGRTAAIYAVVALFHYVFRRRFFLISTSPERAAAEGWSIRFWDFLFYSSFGLVVTQSVAIAGVLLVFCYFVVPAVGGMIYSERHGVRLAIGWVMAVIVSMMGMYLSVRFDLPTGATIVCTFGLVLIAMAGIRPFLLNRSTTAA
jgi:zinc/manganese transport system permease protein